MVQPNGILIGLDGVIVFSQGLIAETEVVVGLHKTRVERDRLAGVGDGGAELLRVVVEARKPVRVERIAGVRRGEPVEFGPRPVAMLERDVSHRQREPGPVIQGGQRLGFLHGNGGIEIFAI